MQTCATGLLAVSSMIKITTSSSVVCWMTSRSQNPVWNYQRLLPQVAGRSMPLLLESHFLQSHCIFEWAVLRQCPHNLLPTRPAAMRRQVRWTHRDKFHNDKSKRMLESSRSASNKAQMTRRVGACSDVLI